MPREKELFRANVELIRERFGDTMTLTMKDAADYVGVDVRTLKKFDVFLPNSKIVSVPKLARILS